MPTSALAAALLASPARAQNSPELEAYFTQQIERMEEGYAQGTATANAPSLATALETVPPGHAAPESAWMFRNFYLRVRTPVGFTIGIAKVLLVPELELLWQRDWPDGWQAYHP